MLRFLAQDRSQLSLADVPWARDVSEPGGTPGKMDEGHPVKISEYLLVVLRRDNRLPNATLWSYSASALRSFDAAWRR